MDTRTSAKVVLLIGLLLAGPGCASSGPPAGMAGPEPMLSVERFLQAANTQDFEAMAHIFGTDKGAVARLPGSTFGCAFRRVGSWMRLSTRCVSWQSIEVWMNTIALVLQHDDYRIRSDNPVAGRRSPTRRVMVDLERGGRRFEQVPFVVVRVGEGRWLVEEVGLERVTGAR
jgi:hypothetical protein